MSDPDATPADPTETTEPERPSTRHRLELLRDVPQRLATLEQRVAAGMQATSWVMGFALALAFLAIAIAIAAGTK